MNKLPYTGMIAPNKIHYKHANNGQQQPDYKTNHRHIKSHISELRLQYTNGKTHFCLIPVKSGNDLE